MPTDVLIIISIAHFAKVDFKKRANGSLTAVASLTQEQVRIARMLAHCMHLHIKVDGPTSLIFLPQYPLLSFPSSLFMQTFYLLNRSSGSRLRRKGMWWCMLTSRMSRGPTRSPAKWCGPGLPRCALPEPRTPLGRLKISKSSSSSHSKKIFFFRRMDGNSRKMRKEWDTCAGEKK